MTHAPQLKILVVDDDAISRLLVARLVEQMGHFSVVAGNGVEAVEVYEREQPDLVLMDVLMPEMDGYEATRRIKALAADKWVPVIFLTRLDSDNSLIQALEVEADDYLVKPVNFATLRAKIGAMQHVFSLQEEVRIKSQELENHSYEVEEEKRIITHLMEQITHQEGLQDPALNYCVIPAEHHSGDLIASQRSPSQALNVMLADGTGHGLAAAINVLPLPPIFYSMAGRGFPLSRVVQELNRKAFGWLPTERYVAAILATVDERNRRIAVWNGGLPPALLMSAEGEILYRWDSRQLPLGILDDPDCGKELEYYSFDRPGQLIMMSDGVIEAPNAAGERYGQERALDVLRRSPPTSRFKNLLDDLNAHLHGHPASDDVSLIIVEVMGDHVPPLPEPEVVRELAPKRSAGEGWHLEMRLNASELPHFDLAPQLTALLGNIPDIHRHDRTLFLILSELFSNALDHGLLRLGSDIPCGSQNSEAYLAERERRLGELREGWIFLRLETVTEDGEHLLRIRVQDSGAGFDHARLERELAERNRPCGHGLWLVKRLVRRLEFQGGGAAVTVDYAL
ncbi:MAG TPA: fused response regulator/phosphatase [Methylococcaceae bacterium]|nr:fused response regulator/phosphatase [Methylococcaceae bacterium]